MFSLQRAHPFNSLLIKLPWSIVLSFLLLIPVLLFFTTYSSFLQDDAYITYRYAHNLANGFGFVYNQGEPVLGTTTPLYAILLAVVAFITQLPVPQISLAINFFSLWGGGILLYAIGKRESTSLGVFCAIAYLTHPLLKDAMGMESLFFIFLLLLGLWAYFQDWLGFSAVVWGLALLTRYETIVFIGIVALFELVKRKRFPLWLWPALAIFLFWAIYATITFGSLIPASATAKLITPRVPFALGAIAVTAMRINEQPFFALSAYFFVIGLLFLHRYKWKHLSSGLLLVWTLLYFLVCSLIAGSFLWYYLPLLPGIFLFIGAGVEIFSKCLALLLTKVIRRCEDKRSVLANIGKTVLFSSLILINLSVWWADWNRSRGHIVDLRHAPYSEAALWLNENATQSESLLTEEIGFIGYFCEMSVYDLFALVAPELHPWMKEEREVILKHALDIYSPNYVLLRTELVDHHKLMSSNSEYAVAYEKPKDDSLFGFILYEKVIP